MTHLEEFLANNGRNWLMQYALNLSKDNPAIAEDLVQDTLERLCISAHNYNPEQGAYKKWVGTILYTLWLNSFSREPYRDSSNGVDPKEYAAHLGGRDVTVMRGGTGSTKTEYGRNETSFTLATTTDEKRLTHMFDVAQAIRAANLTPQEHALLIWVDMEGVSCREAALRYRAAFQKSISLHRQHLHRIMSRIRAKVRPFLAAYASEYGRTGAVKTSYKTSNVIPLAA